MPTSVRSMFPYKGGVIILISIALSFALYRLSDMSSHFGPFIDPSRGEYPGDNILSNAAMVYDQTIFIPRVTPAEIFPWLLQLGAQRAGWYLPFWLEAALPERIRASRVLEPQWTNLNIGQQVPDFQLPFFDKEGPTFKLMEMSGTNSVAAGEQSKDDEEYHAIWKSERYGCQFTWTQMTRSAVPDASHSTKPGSLPSEVYGAVVHLRFRGVIQAQGLKRAFVVWGGEKMDWASTQPMLAGLRDRVLMAKKEK